MKIIEKAKTAATVKKVTIQNPIYDIIINSADGNPIELSAFKGKYIMFVNVASECGFTKQYHDLQKLSDIYKDKLVVIGCPSNQFGEQEPGSISEIQAFCEDNFGVTFLLTEKIDVKGYTRHPLYKWLTNKKLNGKHGTSVKWNFQKYLVNKEGALIDYYYSFTKPMSTKITKHLV